MTTLRRVLFAVVLLAVFCPPGECQSLAEVAAEAKRKKQESTRPVLTNDEMRAVSAAGGLPGVRLLGKSANPPSLAPYEATPMPAVEALLEVAEVQQGEVVFDIGSGDGRIVIAAAEQFGALGVGVEIDSDLVARSRKTIEGKGLADRVSIIHANALDVDLSAADVVTLYIAPEGMRILRPHLEATLRPGTRVVSRRAEMEGWTPVRIERREGDPIYLYRMP